jgi:hypothetical protein
MPLLQPEGAEWPLRPTNGNTTGSLRILRGEPASFLEEGVSRSSEPDNPAAMSVIPYLFSWVQGDDRELAHFRVAGHIVSFGLDIRKGT